MKYCPKCGNRLDANAKYCDKCGTDVSNVNKKPNRPAPISQIKKPASVSVSNQLSAKRSRIRRNCLIVAACVVLLAAGGVVFFTLQSENASNSLPFVTHNKSEKMAEKIGYSPNKKMSSKNMAGFTIAYAHMHFQDDPDWDEVFDKAENGDLNIASYPEYTFGDYDVKAPAGGIVYVVSPDIGYVVSDVDHPNKAQVIFVNSQKGAEKPVYFHALAQKVASGAQKNDVQSYSKNVVVSDHDESTKDSSTDTKQNSVDSKSLSWNDTKEEKLADFMDDFGNKMDQDYVEYTGDEPLKTIAGEKYPNIFDDEDFELIGNNKKINIGWDPELKKDYDYHVVSIFNSDGDGGEEHITYLFCIHDNQPIALVDQTTNGNAIKVKETANQDVRKGFAKIATSSDDD